MEFATRNVRAVGVKAITIEDLRQRARRRLPRAVFDFVDGGSEDEVTLSWNRRAFGRYTFRPRALADVARPELGTTVLGERLRSPLIIAPTGMAGICWPYGEIVAARAAARQGLIYTLSTHSSCSIEEVAAATDGPLWFQLYVWQNRDLTRSFVERARAAGYRALVLTVDVAVISTRERDIRNGFTIPPRITASNLLDTIWRVAWIRGVLRGPKLTLKNLVGAPGAPRSDLITLGGVAHRQIDPSVAWAQLDWFRSLWSGPLLLKGICTADDARLALEHGVDGIVVSNHGGRQLDGAPASLEALREIAAVVEGKLDLILDSGIRRGSDVVKAIALGARAVMIGRPYLYGLASDGEAGVERAIEILHAELERTLALIGVPRLSDLNPSCLRHAPAVAVQGG